MSDRFVTVAKFYAPYEAELARALLAREGIESFVFGALSSSIISGVATFGDRTQLQVHENNAQRATQILATQAARVELEVHPEEQVEEDTWLCTRCGAVGGADQTRCESCQTPRDAVQAASPDRRLAVQTEPAAPLDPEGIQQTPALTAPRSEATEPDEQEAPEPPLLPNEERAKSAFGMALLGWIVPLPIFPLYSLWLLLGVCLNSEDLGSKGKRYFYWALALDVGYLIAVFLLCSAVNEMAYSR